MEQSLIAAFQACPDETSFTPLFEATKGVVYTVCRRVLRNPTDAEDAFQETYSRLFQLVQGRDQSNVPDFNGGTDASSVLARLAYLEADRLRHKRARRQRREILVDTYPEDQHFHNVVADKVMTTEVRAILQKAVADLPDRYRVPLELHYFDGFTHARIAEMMGVPLSTVSSQIRRGTEQLEKPLRRAGVHNAGTLLGVAIGTAALLAPPSHLSAASVFAAAQAAAAAAATTGVAAQGAAAASIMKIIGGIGGIALVGAVIIGGGYYVAKTFDHRMDPQPLQAAVQKPAQAPTLIAQATPSPAAAAVTPAPVKQARLTGHVYAPDGSGIGGIRVTLTRQNTLTRWIGPTSTITHTDGSYNFDSVPPGTGLVGIELDADSPYCLPDEAYVMLTNRRELAGIDFRLLEGARVVGYVNSETSGPVPGARVSVNVLKVPEQQLAPCQRRVIEGDERFLRKTVVTDDKGFFEAKGFEPGSRIFSIEAAADHFVPVFLQPPAPFAEPLEVTLKRGTTVQLIVKDGGNDTPVSKFRYRFSSGWAWGVGWEHPFMEWTDADAGGSSGKVLVKAVPPGEWEIEVQELDDYGVPTGRRADTVYAVSDAENIVNLAIGGAGMIAGKVIDSRGKPVSGARVQVYPYLASVKSQSDEQGLRKDEAVSKLLLGMADGAGALGSALSQPDGSFLIPGLCPGKYELMADKEDLVNIRRVWVDVGATGRTQASTLRLGKAAGLYGRIKGPDGQIMAGATIRAIQGTYGGVPLVQSGSDGYYAIPHLRPDRYKVAVEGYDDSAIELVLAAGETVEFNFDLSGRLPVTGQITVNGRPTGKLPFRLLLRALSKGYPIAWDGDTGFGVEVDEATGSYRVEAPAGEYFLWARYPDNRWVIADTFKVTPETSGNARNVDLQIVDVSVVVLGPDAKVYDRGIACFDQRIPSHTEPRVFSMDLREQHNLFTDLLAGDYMVSFVSNDGKLEGRSEWATVGNGCENAIILYAKPVKNGTKIGTWNPTNATTLPNDHVFAANPALDGPGVYQATVLYEWGHHGMRIESVCLMENGREIVRDAHDGWSGKGKRNHRYLLDLPSVNPAAQYAVVVRMRSDGGTISQGTVYLAKLQGENAAN